MANVRLIAYSGIVQIEQRLLKFANLGISIHETGALFMEPKACTEWSYSGS